MIKYSEEVLESTHLAPGSGKTRRLTALHRLDPVTGYSVRLTGPRPLDRADRTSEPPDISEQVEATRGCPFCPGNVERATPAFPEQVAPGGRFRRGSSILFPNLMPYGRHSGVCIFSEHHHIPLGEFGQTLYEDALANCLEHLRRVGEEDPGAGCHVVSQNILPSSGGALLHPHLQTNADPHPMNYHRLLLEREEEYAGDSPFLYDLSLAEAHLDRWLGKRGGWSFFTAFAPLGQWELQAVHRSACVLTALTDEEIGAFVTALRAVHRFWKSQGFNAANMALFGTSDGKHPLFARMMLRAPFRPWYRSDRSCYEVGMLEPAHDMLPERLAELMRPSLADALK